jgi:hypothetical protein
MNVEAAIVVGSIASLNVAEILLLTGTAKTGLVETTRGGVVSRMGLVVKPHTKFAANGLPDESLAPVLIVAVCALLAARVVDGAKVAVVPP